MPVHNEAERSCRVFVQASRSFHIWFIREGYHVSESIKRCAQEALYAHLF